VAALADPRRLAVLLLAPVVITALSGCVSTQQRSKWAQLRAQRVLATRVPVQVAAAASPLTVTSVALVRSTRASAIVVELHNSAARPVSDLPISIGVARRGRADTYLNGAAGVAYFQTHAPALAAHADGVFILTVRSRLPSGRVFARVGARSATGLPAPKALPQLGVEASGGAAAKVTVSNPTDVPQEQLQVYAWVARGSRIVAAGQAVIAELAAGASATVTPALLGNTSSGGLHVQSPPTVFD
jgi:hypothetical protein